MEYFQLGQAVAAVSATSPTSSVELIPNSSFFHQHQRPSSVSTSLQPLLATPTTPTSNGVQTFAHNTAFIKREPNTSSIWFLIFVKILFQLLLFLLILVKNKWTFLLIRKR